MANHYKNKVVYDGTTLIDISDTTAVPADVAQGAYYYKANGERIIGTAGYAVSASGSTYTDDGSGNITVTSATATAGTPVATKSAVSNHAVTVTPSVTNTAGLISGGTITGTPVTVSASELVSGSQTITQNGTVDVTELAEVVVSVTGGGNYRKCVIIDAAGSGSNTITIDFGITPSHILYFDLTPLNAGSNTFPNSNSTGSMRLMGALFSDKTKQYYANNRASAANGGYLYAGTTMTYENGVLTVASSSYPLYASHTYRFIAIE